MLPQRRDLDETRGIGKLCSLQGGLLVKTEAREKLSETRSERNLKRNKIRDWDWLNDQRRLETLARLRILVARLGREI